MLLIFFEIYYNRLKGLIMRMLKKIGDFFESRKNEKLRLKKEKKRKIIFY